MTILYLIMGVLYHGGTNALHGFMTETNDENDPMERFQLTVVNNMPLTMLTQGVIHLIIVAAWPLVALLDLGMWAFKKDERDE